MEKMENENTQERVNNASNNLNEKLLIAYIGNNYSKIKSKKFSVPAFFLGYLYTGYRKFYSLTFIMFLLNFLVSIFHNFVTLSDATLATIYVIVDIIINIVISVNFNKWYLKNAEKRVQKIKSDNMGASESDLISLCSKKGKPSVGVAIGCLLIYFVVINVIKAVIGA